MTAIPTNFGMTWRRAGEDPDDRPLAFALGLAAVGACTLVPFVQVFARFAPLCPLHALTGVPCPTCGSTRAAVALSHGDVAAALAFNPLVTLAAVGAFAVALAAPVWVALRGPVPTGGAGGARTLRVVVVGALLVNWLYLIVRGV
jgi:hypothetical protein